MPPPKPGRIFLHNNWFNVPWGLGYWHTALSILIPTSTSTITTVVTDVTATTTVDAFCLAGNPAIPAFCQDRKRRAIDYLDEPIIYIDGQQFQPSQVARFDILINSKPKLVNEFKINLGW